MYNVPTSTTRSFRVDTELAKVLDEESERMGVSVNALVNMILKRYSEFTRFLSKIDLVVINRELLKSLFDSYPDEDIYGLGVAIGEIIPRDTILFWKKTLTYDETTQNDKKIIVIRHRLGQKGSQFLHGFLKSTLKSTLNLDSSFELTESSVKLQINN